jgi:hypothetical protein
VDYKAVLGHVFSPTAYAGRLSRLAVKLDRSDRRRDLPDGDMRKRLGGIVSIRCGPRVAPVRVAKRSSMLCAIVAVAVRFPETGEPMSKKHDEPFIADLLRARRLRRE